MSFESSELEYEFRSRSNTWHAENHPETRVAKETHERSRGTKRRNVWGNSSYADLITQAIMSSPEQKLTLSEIYDWFMENMPYFGERGDKCTSAGWKNSIRHNLSLHSRFSRLPNEKTGKSSWWTVNPDAKTGRKRAMSAGRILMAKHRLEKMTRSNTPSPSSSHSSQDNYPCPPYQPLPAFQFSPAYRDRTYSSSSSCGRLTPIISQECLLDEPVNERDNCEELTYGLRYGVCLQDEHNRPNYPLYYGQQRVRNMPPEGYSSCSQSTGGDWSFVKSGIDLEDISVDTFQGERIQCDVEAVIKHELNVDGVLDFT